MSGGVLLDGFERRDAENGYFVATWREVRVQEWRSLVESGGTRLPVASDIPSLVIESEKAMRRCIAERELAPRRGRQIQYVGCSFPGCTNPHRRAGLCDGHSAQAKRGQQLKALRYRSPNGTQVWYGKYLARKRKVAVVA